MHSQDMPKPILGFTRRHKLCSNHCPPCWCPSVVKFMLIIVHFYSEASLLSLDYFANYMNIQKEKDDESTGDSSKGIPVLSEYAKAIKSRVKQRYSQKISVIGAAWGTSHGKPHFTVRVKEISLWRLISFSEKHNQIHRFES